MASSAGRRVRPEAVVGIAVGVVLLTGVAALAVGGGDDPSQGRPPGFAQSEWARDHHGPPPWAHGKGDRDRHGPPPWARGWDDKDDKDGRGERGRHGPPPWAHGRDS